MNTQLKKLIRELLNQEELDEMSTSGGAGGYLTPNAFKGKKNSYIQPIQEASYRKFKNTVSESTQKQKIRKALKEMRKSIKNVDSLVNFSSKLKEEMGVDNPNWSIVAEAVGILEGQLSEIQTKLKTLYK